MGVKRGAEGGNCGISGWKDRVEWAVACPPPGSAPAGGQPLCSVCSRPYDTWPLHTGRVQAVFHLPASAPIYVRQRLTQGQV